MVLWIILLVKVCRSDFISCNICSKKRVSLVFWLWLGSVGFCGCHGGIWFGLGFWYLRSMDASSGNSEDITWN